MKSIAIQASQRFRRLATGPKYLLIALLLALTFSVALSIKTEYTTKTYVAAIVVAKTESGSARKGNWKPHFILALRHPDGTLQDVRATYAAYATTPIGSTWGVMYSDFDRGRPMPVGDRVRLGVMALSFLGAVLAFAWGLAFYLFPDD